MVDYKEIKNLLKKFGWNQLYEVMKEKTSKSLLLELYKIYNVKIALAIARNAALILILELVARVFSMSNLEYPTPSLIGSRNIQLLRRR